MVSYSWMTFKQYKIVLQLIISNIQSSVKHFFTNWLMRMVANVHYNPLEQLTIFNQSFLVLCSCVTSGLHSWSIDMHSTGVQRWLNL